MGWSALAAAVLLAAAPARAQDRPATPDSFAAAERVALDSVYEGRQLSFYCDCPYALDATLLEGACGYEARRPRTHSGEIDARAHRVEWELVVPASRFGRTRACWRESERFPACREPGGELMSGRDCCYAVDANFRAMHNDLQNLRPAIGELKADRGDLPYGVVGGEARHYGACDFEVEGGVVEPAADHRGDIARTYFYMERVWRMELTQNERDLFETWASEDPADYWELERNRRIEAEQGMESPVFGDLDETACRPRSSCCHICSESRACGDSCVSGLGSCEREPGCACDVVEVCEE